MPVDEYLLRTYGPWVLVAIFAARELWRYLRDKVFPFLMKRAERKDEMVLSLEERQIQALEKIAENQQQLTVLFATINERTMRTDVNVESVKLTLTAHDARSQVRYQPVSEKERTKPLPKARQSAKVES